MDKKSYIWKKEWIWPYETLLGMLNKFAYVNILHQNDIKNLIEVDGKDRGNRYIYYNKYMIISNYRINFNQINALLQSDVATTLYQTVKHILYPLGIDSFPYSFDGKQKQWYRYEFTYCPECMKYGYHSLYHQLTFSNVCFIHTGTRLQKSCPNCGAVEPFALKSKRIGQPYKCTCGYEFFSEEFPNAAERWEESYIHGIRKFKRMNSTEKSSFAIILPYERYSTSWNRLNENIEKKILGICMNEHKLKPNYRFSYSKNRREESWDSMSMDSVYDLAMNLAKRRIQSIHKISRLKHVKYAFQDYLLVSYFGIDTVAYLVWLKMNSGIHDLHYISQQNEFYSDVNERIVLNELLCVERIYLHYSKDLRDIVSRYGIFRIALIKLLKSYEGYLREITKIYDSIKHQTIYNFFNSYRNPIYDDTQFILNLDEGLGEMWETDNTDSYVLPGAHRLIN